MSDHNYRDLTTRQTNQMIGEMHEILFGNGDPQKGLVVRIDRIEQREKLIGGIAGAALAAALSWITGLLPGPGK